MRARETRTRSGAEIAFIVMRSLAAARVLWGNGGALPLDALPGLVPASARVIAPTVARLCALGIAEVSGGTVRLTERGAHEICGRGGAVVPPRATATGGPHRGAAAPRRLT
jgi:hypothetical protein